MAKRCVVSWSGGKDSTLVLRRMREQGLNVVGLQTMFSPETLTSRSHGLPRDLLEAAAEAYELPLHIGHGSWKNYEAEFKQLLRRLVDEGVEVVAFGDIFLNEHRQWVERVCAEVGCEALEPLWGEKTSDLAEEILHLGYRALVCTVRSDRLDAAWLGTEMNRRFLEHLSDNEIDPCGEHGEYHTAVVDGPGMSRRIVIDTAATENSEHYHHWVIERWHSE